MIGRIFISSQTAAVGQWLAHLPGWTLGNGQPPPLHCLIRLEFLPCS